MSQPANENSTLTAPSLPTPGDAPTITADVPPPAPPAPPTLDGDAPRLGETAAAATPTPEEPSAPAIDLPSLPSLPIASPVLASPAGIAEPDDGAGGAPPTTPTPGTDESDTPTVDEPAHPMAHLMPEKTAPSEASRKAAELRAAKKAKGRKIKIGVAAGFVVVAAVAGPPLWSWLTDAINESGNVSTEQPAD